jgi:Fur family ferric uptake transcriptional regulator
MMERMAKKHTHPSYTLEQLYDVLKQNQLKLTPPRKTILEGLLKNHGPFSAEDIHSKFAKKSFDLATVYRNLISLEEAKIIRRCEFGDGIARYELVGPEADHHHHHLVCKDCKKVEVIDLCEMEETINRLAKKKGYKQVSHILEFFGTCPNCQ